MPDEPQKSHWDGCWRAHHACAVRQVELLQERLEEVAEVFRYLDELVQYEDCEVCVSCCDDEPPFAVTVYAEWAHWQSRQFLGETLVDALKSAVLAMRKAKEDKKC